MTFDRPLVTCDVKDCERLAEYRLCFRVWATSETGLKIGAAAEAITGLGVCADHREDTPASFLTDESWEVVRRGFLAAGRMAPDRSTLQVFYTQL